MSVVAGHDLDRESDGSSVEALNSQQRFIRPTLTCGWRLRGASRAGAVAIEKLSIHVSIYAALLHDVERGQMR